MYAGMNGNIELARLCLLIAKPQTSYDRININEKQPLQGIARTMNGV